MFFSWPKNNTLSLPGLLASSCRDRDTSFYHPFLWNLTPLIGWKTSQVTQCNTFPLFPTGVLKAAKWHCSLNYGLTLHTDIHLCFKNKDAKHLCLCFSSTNMRFYCLSLFYIKITWSFVLFIGQNTKHPCQCWEILTRSLTLKRYH